MKAKILVYALTALILTTIHLAEAQQATKVHRIGYLSVIPGATAWTSRPFRAAAKRSRLH